MVCWRAFSRFAKWQLISRAGDEAEEMITRKPRQSFVRVRAWDQ